MRPQDPHGDGAGLQFETGEHGGDYPDNMPQAITVTDEQGRWAVYVLLRVGGKIVVPEPSGKLYLRRYPCRAPSASGTTFAPVRMPSSLPAHKVNASRFSFSYVYRA
jgi:hypothetical protein